MSANSRATRSRYSSPQQNGTDGSGHGSSGSGSGSNGKNQVNGTNAQREMMTRWLEPPVQNRPSFEEAGFQRHGVFEGMAPLGVLPKLSVVTRRLNNLPEEKSYRQNDKLKKKEAVEAVETAGTAEEAEEDKATRSRKIILKRPSAAGRLSADDATKDKKESTATRGRGRPRRSSAAVAPQTAEADQALDGETEGDDDEYKPDTPRTPPVKRPVGRPRKAVAADRAQADQTPQAADPTREDDEKTVKTDMDELAERDDHQATATDSDYSTDAESDDGILFGRIRGLPRFNLTRKRSDSEATEVNKEVTDKVVEMAVDEALSHCRYPTAFALRTLYDEQSSDQGFLTMLEDVFQQTADSETLRTFARLIYDRKKDGRKDDKGYYYFVPPGEAEERKGVREGGGQGPRPPRRPRGHGQTASHGSSPSKDALHRRLVTMRLPDIGADTLLTTGGDPSPSDAGLSTPAAPAAGPAAVGASEKNRPISPPGPKAKLPQTFKPPRTPRPSTSQTHFTQNTQDTPNSPNALHSPQISRLKAPRTARAAASQEAIRENIHIARTPRRTLGSSVRGRMASAVANAGAAAADATASSASSLSPPASLATPDRTADVSMLGGDETLLEAKGRGEKPLHDEQNVDVDMDAPGDHRRSMGGAAPVTPAVGAADAAVTAVAAAVTVAAETATAPTPAPAPAPATDGKDDGKVSVSKDAASKVASSAPPADKTPGKAKGKVAKASKAKAAAAKKAKGKPGQPATGPGSGRGGRRAGAGRPPKIKRDPAAVAAAAAKSAAAKGTAAAAALGDSGSTPKPAKAAKSTAPATPLQRSATRSSRSSRKAAGVSMASALISPSNATSDATPDTTPAHAQSTRSASSAQPAPAPAPKSSASTSAMPSAVHGTPAVTVRTVSVAKRLALQRNGSDVLSLAPSSSLKAASGVASRTVSAEEQRELQERRASLRRESRNVTNGAHAVFSFARGSPPHADSDETESADSREPSVDSLAVAPMTTTKARKRPFDEVDDDFSPIGISFSSELSSDARLTPALPDSSALNSRPGTPGPRAKRPRVGPRVKTSPMKRKAATSAGVPRPSGERGSPAANGLTINMDENDDYCASCGGSGELVCCDGCTRSFHFNCVDPPLQEGSNLPDEWFCNVCAGKRKPAALVHHRSVLGALLVQIDKKNSSAFRLPSDIRERFEGVTTGPDGEYEDIVPPVTNRVKKRGYEEAPDFFRYRDTEGRAVLCHNCSGFAQDDRPIIPCAFCGLWWHIDCLDPPMANPPVLRNWRCPAHVDDLLDKLPGMLGPAHRFRKIKDALVIQPAFARGLANNGFIEITSDDESDESDDCAFGRIQRISARGVQLDFLEQIRKAHKGRLRRERINRRLQYLAPKAASCTPPAASPPPVFLTDRRILDEAQATQNLSALNVLSVDHTGELIKALLSQADPTAVAIMAQGSALNIEAGAALTQDDCTALAAMRARIDKLLSRATAMARQDVTMSDAPVVDDEERQRDSEETGSKSSPDQTQEVMSLVSDNGDSELGEDPLPIATPLTATHEESAAAAVWPAEHHSSDSVRGPSSGGLSDGKDGFLCSPEAPKAPKEAQPQDGTSPMHAAAAVLQDGRLTHGANGAIGTNGNETA